MIANALTPKTWYDVRIIGVRRVEIGQNRSAALEVAVRFEDDSQASTTLFLTAASIANTRKRLEALGCTDADMTGENWLRKLNLRLANTQASVVADEQEKYGIRLNGPFPRGGGAAPREVEAGPSPFGAIGDQDVPF